MGGGVSLKIQNYLDALLNFAVENGADTPSFSHLTIKYVFRFKL
jgi:hypothetical protein